MRLGGTVDGQPLGLDHGAQVSAGAALAIGARDMERRWQVRLRVAQPGQHGADRLQPETPLRQGERRQTVQLRLDAGIVRCGEIAQGGR